MKYQGNYEVKTPKMTGHAYTFAVAQKMALNANVNGDHATITNKATGKVWEYSNSKRRASLKIYSQSKRG